MADSFNNVPFNVETNNVVRGLSMVVSERTMWGTSAPSIVIDVAGSPPFTVSYDVFIPASGDYESLELLVGDMGPAPTFTGGYLLMTAVDFPFGNQAVLTSVRRTQRNLDGSTQATVDFLMLTF